MFLLGSAARARNISSSYVSRYIYRAGYVLTFKRSCYWIMNVPKRPKFRMRGEHYFRRGSNNFVRFYITRPRSASSAGLVYRLQRVPHVEKCIRSTAATRTVYVTARPRPFAFVAHREISFVACESSFAKCMMCIILLETSKCKSNFVTRCAYVRVCALINYYLNLLLCKSE